MQGGDDGRTSNCTGVTYLRNEQVSVYDDSDPATLTVVARVGSTTAKIPGDHRRAAQDARCKQ